MNKAIIVTILLSMNMNKIKSVDFSEDQFSDFYSNIKLYLNYDRNCEYDEKIFAEDFNFKLFQEERFLPALKSEGFQIYKRKGEVQKIQCFKDDSLHYELNVIYKDNTRTLYVAFLPTSDPVFGNGEFAIGFFVYEKKLRTNYYYSLSPDVLSYVKETGDNLLSQIYQEDEKLSVVPYSQTKDIIGIYKLNNNLIPVSKLHFDDNELIYRATFEEMEDRLIQNTTLLSRDKSCKKVTLSSTKLVTIYRFLNDSEHCNEISFLKVIIDFELNFNGYKSWVYMD